MPPHRSHHVEESKEDPTARERHGERLRRARTRAKDASRNVQGISYQALCLPLHRGHHVSCRCYQRVSSFPFSIVIQGSQLTLGVMRF